MSVTFSKKVSENCRSDDKNSKNIVNELTLSEIIFKEAFC